MGLVVRFAFKTVDIECMFQLHGGIRGFSPTARLVKNRLCLGEIYASYAYVEMGSETYFFGRNTYTSSRKPTRALTFV